MTTIHNFLKACLHTYKWGKDEHSREKISECVAAETRLFADCGKILQVVGGILSAATAEKRARLSESTSILSPEERSEALEARGFKMEKQIFLAEKKYRKSLSDVGIYHEELKPLPDILFPDPEPEKDKDQKRKRRLRRSRSCSRCKKRPWESAQALMMGLGLPAMVLRLPAKMTKL